MRPELHSGSARRGPRLALLALALLATPAFAQQARAIDPPPSDAPQATLPVPPADAAPAPQATSTAPVEGVPPAEVPEPATTDDAAATDTPVVDGTAPAAQPDTAQATPTEAEQDFDALYGAQGAATSEYNPVADPTLPAPAQVPGAYDPWEPYNRRMHRFNNAVDRRVARPLAQTYVRVVPRPLRLGVSNFFNNLGQPVSALNALLQGKPKQAAQSLGRFMLNTTLGIGGIFDPALDARLPNRSEDFGQTLGVWGWKRSRYLELPLFGPRTVRDAVGMVGDSPLSPLRQVEADKVRVPIQGLQLVEIRTQLLSTDSLRAGAADDYALVRDAWSQRRNYQIFGDRKVDNNDELPDYLREENNPLVPVDAMPVLPPGG